jgi:flagellar biosynthetic protein FliR
LTRIAPALNAFSLGFPLKIVLTLMLVGFVLVRLPTVLSGTVGQAVDAMLRLTGSG